MTELNQLQMKFAFINAQLVIEVYKLGYTLTMGEGYNAAGIGHKPNSNHYIKLAHDWNLFKDGVYLQGKEAEEGHNKLHDIWDSLGGAPRIAKDLNHYSIVYNGKW